MAVRQRRSTPPGRQVSSLVELAARTKRERDEALARLAIVEAELAGIRDALSGLGRKTAGARTGSRASALGVPALPQVEKRKRKPITDPVILEKRRQALMRARQVRAEQREAAREAQVATQAPETGAEAREA